MADTRQFARGERIAVKTPGRYSRIVNGAVTGGDEHFVTYRSDDGRDLKTRRGAIQPGNPPVPGQEPQPAAEPTTDLVG